MIDYMEKYFLNVWMFNYLNLVVIVVEVCCVLRLNLRIINICDMLVCLEEIFVRVLGLNFCKDFDVRYYGLNYFGWWISIKDKEGNDLMFKV